MAVEILPSKIAGSKQPRTKIAYGGTVRGQKTMKNKNSRGFSLMETLIYVAIFGTVASALMGIVWNITKIHSHQLAANEVDSNLRYVLNLINEKVREASLIDSATGSTLVLTMTAAAKNPTTFSLSGGVLYIQEGSGAQVAVTSNRVNVDSLTFDKISMAGAKGGARINISLSYKAEGRPELTFVKSLVSTVSRVTAVTFDSDLLPATTNYYDVGVDSTRWKNAYFTGTISATGSITSGSYVTGTTGLCIAADCKTSWASVGVTGSGTQNYITKWATGSTLGNSVIYDNGTNVGIGTTGPNALLEVAGGSTGRVQITDGGGASRKVLILEQPGYEGHSYARIESYDYGTSSGKPLALNALAGNVLMGQTTDDGSNKLQVTGSATISGNVGIGTTAPGAKLDVNGNLKVHNVQLDESFRYDETILFAPQAYFEAESPNAPANWVWNIDGFEKENNINPPFSQVAKSSTYDQLYSDYIPVNPGDRLYGEIWAMRDNGATGTAGTLYYGIERYDKDKKPITTNNGCIYFAAGGVTVPTDGVWQKYSEYTTLPTSHTVYDGSDGGPVRYVRVRILVDYSAGTIPTHWGGIILRRVEQQRDLGNIAFNGNVGIGTTGPGAKLEVVTGTGGTGDSGDDLQLQGGYGVLATYTDSTNTTLRINAYNLATGTYDGMIDFVASYATNPSNMRFFTSAGSSPVERVRITGSGNVGIGTTNPGAKLDVVGGSIRTDGYVSITGVSDASGNLRFSAANPYIYSSSYLVIPGGAYFSSGTVYTEATIQARGGIADDGGDLYLNDNAVVTGNLTVSGSINGNTMARAYRSANMTVTPSAWTKLALNAENYDPGSNFDVTNNRYNVPTTGYYLITGRTTFTRTAATGNVYISIYVNGAEQSRGASGNEGENNLGWSTRVHTDILYLTAGNYVELYFYENGNNTLNGGSALTSLAIMKL